MARGGGGEGSTQEFLEIDDVRRGVIVWRDGTYSSILRIGTINVELQSDEERLRIQAQFRRFLDSVRFPFQIYVRKIVHSVDAYLGYLQECARRETDRQILSLIGLYYDFIQTRGQAKEFYEQQFYIVLNHGEPKTELPVPGVGGLVEMLPFGAKRKGGSVPQAGRNVAAALHQLELMASTIQSGLQPLGITVEMLGTLEVMELFFSIYADEHYQVEKSSGNLANRLALYTGLANGDPGPP